MPSVLLFGATGLIGSHLIPAIRAAHPAIPLTVYNRNASPELDAYFHSLGVSAVVHGDFSEDSKISTLTASHDIAINCGSSWDVPLSKAIIEGLRERHAEGKGKGSLIHVSGAGNFIDDSIDGAFKEGSRTFNDNNEEDMKLINASMLNGGPDVEVLEAGKDGHVNTYVIFPSGAYGESVGPIKALGVIQLFMAQKAKELGFVPYVGAGTSIFNSIHVKDVPPFIVKVLDQVISTSEPEGSVFSRCYIIGGQNNAWKDVSNSFARLFHQKGLIDSPVAKSVSYEEAGEGELPNLMAKNMLFKSDRAEKLGYEPVQASLIEHLAKGLEDYSEFA